MRPHAEIRLVLIAYDVSDDRRRRKVVKTAIWFGARVQKSVFAAWVDERAEAEMQQLLQRAIDPQEDALLLVRCCPRCERGSRTAGTMPQLQAPPRWFVV